MPFARVNDLNSYYEVCGDEPGRVGAPAVLFLHGLGSSAADWALQAPAFAAQYRVITVDLRGHGRSQDRALGYTIAQLADDVAALLAQLAEPACHVVGLSLGGCVAQALALRYPERVRSLVLVNTFARLQSAGLRGRLRLMKRAWLFVAAPMPALAAYVAAGLFPKPEQRPLYTEAVTRLSHNSKRPYLACMRAVTRFDVRRELGALRCPTLIVVGDRDQTVPRASAEVLRRAIPAARFALIRDSGHATPIDQVEEFNRVVMAFIEEVGLAGREGDSSLRSE